MAVRSTVFWRWGEGVFRGESVAQLSPSSFLSPCSPFSPSISLFVQPSQFSPQQPLRKVPLQTRFLHSSVSLHKTTHSPPPPSSSTSLHRKALVACASRVYRCYSFYLFPFYFSRQLSKHLPPLPLEEDGDQTKEKWRKKEAKGVTKEVDSIVAEHFLAKNTNPPELLAWKEIPGEENNNTTTTTTTNNNGTDTKALDIQEQGHVVIGATVLANYRLLRQRDYTERDALRILQKALLGCGPNWVYSVIDLPLQLSSNKRRLLMEKDQLMGGIHDFIDLISDCLAGRSYDLSIWSDSVNDSIVTVTVNKCFFHSFFEEQGEPQLTELFCSWEKEVILSNIEPQKHYLRAQQTKCLAKGDKNCHFCFHHKERSESLDTLKNFVSE